MWAIIAILGLVLFLICIPSFVYALKRKKKGGIAIYAIMAGISYCILLFGGLEAISEYQAAKTEEAKNAAVIAEEDQEGATANDMAGKVAEEAQPMESTDELSDETIPAETAKQSAEKKAELDTRPDEAGGSPNRPDEIISDEIPDEVEPPGKAPSLPEQLTASGGIGDTLSVLGEEYGYNAGDENHASFKRGALTADLHPPTKRAYQIEYGYVGDVGGALRAISDMIPADSVQLDMVVGKDKVMISYRSEMLSQTIQEGDFVASFNVTKVGKDKLASYINISLGSFTSTKESAE
ncbi:hypothetical protein M3201_14325 [Paenibacillus motobuensis]|uniref:hypothetical protein n=1 Tax=Paenibacillus TaxID=44249 RepID=UPI00203DC540|nr:MULTISPECIES: hypothetical protein [Paenibacillus]MCM3040877.1 hypothetical protein [Paenibacillus lutimineralis]MCM3647981.1 hypothetical protein [Paenibacillus motobuensis]